MHSKRGCQILNRWKDDGEYWTSKGRIHHKGNAKYIISIKKDTNIVLESDSGNHAKQNHRGAT